MSQLANDVVFPRNSSLISPYWPHVLVERNCSSSQTVSYLDFQKFIKKHTLLLFQVHECIRGCIWAFQTSSPRSCTNNCVCCSTLR